jgi:membrane protein YdbS with pleckstrin-like domain
MPEISSPPPGEVRPHRNLRSLYLTYLLIIIWAGILPWLVPITFFTPPDLILIITIPLLLVVIFLIWWTGAYYRTILYRFSDTAISWERGVWWRQTGIVPYNRITTVDIIQGPLSRFFGISMLKIHIAGNLAGTESAAELKINGIIDAGALRESILNQTRSRTRGGEAGMEEEQILDEQVAVRKIIEKKGE